MEFRIHEQPHLASSKILNRHVATITDAMAECKTFSIGTVTRTYVVASLESKTFRNLGCTSCDRHPINLRAAATVRGENDITAVWRKTWLGIDAGTLSKALESPAIGVDQEDLRPTHHG